MGHGVRNTYSSLWSPKGTRTSNPTAIAYAVVAVAAVGQVGQEAGEEHVADPRVGNGQLDRENLLEQCTPGSGGELDTSAEDPDRVSTVLFTSGTTRNPKGVLTTHNQWYAALSQRGPRDDITSADVMFTPHVLTHAAGLTYGNLLPLRFGARGAMTDSWRDESGPSLVEEIGVTYFVGHPIYVSALVTAANKRNMRDPHCASSSSAGAPSRRSSGRRSTKRSGSSCRRVGP